MNNPITIFMKKKYFKILDVKIVLRILIRNIFKTTLQMDLKKLYECKVNICNTASNFYVSNYKSL